MMDLPSRPLRSLLLLADIENERVVRPAMAPGSSRAISLAVPNRSQGATTSRMPPSFLPADCAFAETYLSAAEGIN
jgi:hypothetical protein